MDEEEEIEIKKVNMACFFLIKAMLNTNANEMKIKQKNVYNNEKVLGDFEIIIRKIKK